ncbi:MAG: DUF1684 domain-containing protein [Bacteroidota bacterium]
MKFICLILSLLLIGCSGGKRLTNTELETSRQDVQQFQDKLNKQFSNEDTSPLVLEKVPSFEGLDFFDIDPSYVVKAELVRTPNEKPFQMPTYAGKEKTFKKYGELHFKMKGKKRQLNVYQNLRTIAMPLYRDHLFLPFTDLSNGAQSYGGGRYIDLKIPKEKNIILNFNLAYNPYCAYSDRYNCPIPPKENHLAIAVLAGVKAYQK